MLVEKEVIFHADVEAILGVRPWKSRTDELMELNQKKQLENKGDEADKNSESEGDPDSDNKVEDVTGEVREVSSISSENDTDPEDAGTPPPFRK